MDGIDETVFKNIVTNDDHILSERKARNTWDYVASIGVSGTPTAFVNGVRIDDMPRSADAWNQYLAKLMTSTVEL